MLTGPLNLKQTRIHVCGSVVERLEGLIIWPFSAVAMWVQFYLGLM